MESRFNNGLTEVASFNNIEMMNIPSPISRNSEIIESEKVYNEKNYSIKLYFFVSEISYALLHTFFLSLFEVIFYWNYVAIRERKAIINKTKMLSLLLQPACSYYKNYDQVNFESMIQEIIDTLQNKNNTQNKNTSLSMSITLSLILLSMYGLVELINYKINLRLKNKTLVLTIPTFWKEFRNNLYRGGICLIFVSAYEALFFQLVIVNFNPIDEGELMLRILKGCIDIA